VLHSSLKVLWRVSGLAKDGVEGLQKQLARELKTDKVATSCAKIMRLLQAEAIAQMTILPVITVWLVRVSRRRRGRGRTDRSASPEGVQCARSPPPAR
jgi:hypothetical protein